MRPVIAASLIVLVAAAAACATAPGKKISGITVVRPPHEVSAIATQGEILWAGGREGVFKIDLKTARLAGRLEPPRPVTYVRALLVDANGALWIGYGEGLLAWDGGSWRSYSQKDGLPDGRVNCLLQDHSGRIWAGTWGGAACLENDRWSVIRKTEGLCDDMVNVMMEDRDGGLWFGSYVAPTGGLSLLGTDGKWRRWTVADGLPHNNINYLFQDSGGAVWAATGFLDRGGACCFEKRGDKWNLDRVIERKDGLAGDKCRSVFQDHHGVYWFGSEYDGTARFDGQRWRVLTESDGFSGQEAKVVAEDRYGALWFATNDGVTRLGPEALQALSN